MNWNMAQEHKTYRLDEAPVEIIDGDRERTIQNKLNFSKMAIVSS